MLNIKTPWPGELVVSRNVSRNYGEYFCCQPEDMHKDDAMCDGDTVTVYKFDRFARVQKLTQLTPVPENGKRKSRKASPAGKK